MTPVTKTAPPVQVEMKVYEIVYCSACNGMGCFQTPSNQTTTGSVPCARCNGQGVAFLPVNKAWAVQR